MKQYAGQLEFGGDIIRLTTDLIWESDGNPASDEMVDYLQTEAFEPPNDYSFSDGDEAAWMLKRAAELMPMWAATINPNREASPRDLLI